MSDKPKNTYAFPLTDVYGPKGELKQWGDSGMTLRDYFAAKALQGFCADPNYLPKDDETFEDYIDGLVKNCYEFADAMLKARES